MDFFLQSPPYSSGSYDSVKTELSMSAEDLTSGRAQIIDDDDDDHDDHDDSDKINDAEGMDPERLKAFNVSIPSCYVRPSGQDISGPAGCQPAIFNPSCCYCA